VRTPWAEADEMVADTMLAAIDDLPRRAILMAYGGDLDPKRNTSEIAAKFGSRGNYRVERDRGLRQIISQGFPVEAPRPSSLLWRHDLRSFCFRVRLLRKVASVATLMGRGRRGGGGTFRVFAEPLESSGAGRR
jgi:hypothetical protein